MDLKFKGKTPELIKIAIASGSGDTFFDSSNDYEPVSFKLEDLEYIYGSQIFTDILNKKNMIWTREVITEPCLSEATDFINNTHWILTTGSWDDAGSWMDFKTWLDI